MSRRAAELRRLAEDALRLVPDEELVDVINEPPVPPGQPAHTATTSEAEPVTARKAPSVRETAAIPPTQPSPPARRREVVAVPSANPPATVPTRRGPRPANDRVKVSVLLNHGMLYDFRLVAEAHDVEIGQAIRRFVDRCLSEQQMLVLATGDVDEPEERTVATDYGYVSARDPATLSVSGITLDQRHQLRIMSRTSGVPIKTAVESFVHACVQAGRILDEDEPWPTVRT